MIQLFIAGGLIALGVNKLFEMSNGEKPEKINLQNVDKGQTIITDEQGGDNADGQATNTDDSCRDNNCGDSHTTTET